jgi:LCP family protein required for cell wall assembly
MLGHSNDEHATRRWLGTWRGFFLAAFAIAALSGGAAAAIALNKINGIAEEVFPKINQVSAPRSLVTPEYSGGPETFLILGSDRREGSQDVFDRTDPPHSDTILLVRFDPEQGQTSVLSIPRDLMVNIVTSGGQVYANEKINAAYTIGSRLGGAKGAMLLAAETIKKEVFPQLTLNAIVDVNFKGFIRVVDSLGCAYVNVDHRYLGGGTATENYSAINLQPGYQKLCYEDALSYVRYRHTDSDFVRVARQQDFLRDLREQVSAEDVLGQIDTVAKAVGHAITSTVHGSGSELLKLARLIAFSQTKPLRQVRFLAANENYQYGNGSYVTSTPELERQTLESFLHGHETLHLPAAAPASKHSSHHHAAASSATVAGLVRTSTEGDDEVVKASVGVPFRVLYPTLQTAQGTQEQTRPYALRDPGGHLHRAYVIVWRQNVIGGYYDFQGTDWLDPPLFVHAHTQLVDGRPFKIVDDGSHVHVVGWRAGHDLYWVTNTLLEELSNAQMLAIARSARGLRSSAGGAGRSSAGARRQTAVQRGVDQRVGVGVLGARDGADRPTLEAAQGAHRRRVQRPHRLVLDLVEALHLLGDQLRVSHHLDLAGAELPRPLQAEQQRSVLGDVVRGLAQQARLLLDELPLGGGDHARRRRGTGVAARAAVDMDDQLHRRESMQGARDGTHDRRPTARLRRGVSVSAS